MSERRKSAKSETATVVVRLGRGGKKAVVTPEMKAQLRKRAASTSSARKGYPELPEWRSER